MRTAKLHLGIGTVFFSMWIALASAPARAASAQVYLPNNNQWTGENVYQGATLILAYADGNAGTFTPEQSTLFKMTSGWLTGAAQAMGAVETFDKTPRGSRCLSHLQQLTLVDVARKYADYWTAHPEEHNKASLAILVSSMYAGHPCN